MAVTKLTEARIRDLKLGSGIHRDTEVKGLMVICHKTTKSYAVQGDVRRNGRHVRTVRVKIDRVDRIGLRDARNRARVLMSQIQSGVDPTDGPAETGITLSGALDAHLEEKQRRPRTVEGYRYHLDHYLKNWRNKAVADISRQMVRDMFADLKRRHGEPTAASVTPGSGAVSRRRPNVVAQVSVGLRWTSAFVWFADGTFAAWLLQRLVRLAGFKADRKPGANVPPRRKGIWPQRLPAAGT